jgi:HD-GYP domain-containing protein (c-di-GMP phosphodiesterase class II)
MIEQRTMTELREWFAQQARSFLTGDTRIDRNILLKEEHCRNVAAGIVDIARSSGFPQEDLPLAETIGLLHDVGRFAQYARYRTFSDRKSVDHARLAVDLLDGSCVLEGLVPDDRRCIIGAIRFHNARTIPEQMEEREAGFARLVRDADKLDIYRIVADYYECARDRRNETVELDLPDAPAISEAILAQVQGRRTAEYRHLRTLNDFKVLQLGWVYDLNFRRTAELLRERRYLDRIYATLPQTSQTQAVYEQVRGHLAAVSPGATDR